MPNFCLPPDVTKKFLKGLKDGDIDPGKMAGMSSEERRGYLADFVGEKNAKAVNALFESKLLLKNQQQGMITWAKTIGGLKDTARRDIISKVNKLDKVLSETDQQSFLNDLADQRLGVGLSIDEANNIAKLAKDVANKKNLIGTDDRLDYGRARVKFQNYLNELKDTANQKSIKEQLKNPIKVVSDIAGTAKSLKASLDDSAIFRQGWKTLFTHPGIWKTNALQSFKNLYRSFGGKAVIDELNADIVSRPTYEMMRKAKLGVANIDEESFPSHLPEKIPVFKKFYKASEDAFTAFVQKTRADVFDKYIKMAQDSGVDLDDKQLQSIGKLVNSLTGRGSLGKLEPAANVINNVFFSPRALKSHIDTLLVHATDKGFSTFARKQAAINLVKIITGTAGILTTAAILKPGSVEKDPRSSDFGKIRIGNTRFDMTGGMSSLITLAFRLAQKSTKSATTGKITLLNQKDKTGKPKFGAPTEKDQVYNFFEDKLSPAASIIKDIFNGEDFNGNKPTIGNETKNLLEPLPISNFEELEKNPNSANILLSVIADSLGISTNTYGPAKK